MRDIIGQNKTCLEQDCTITIQGKSFTSGGAFIGIDKNGKHGGWVYAYPEDSSIGNWHGDIKIPAIFGKQWTNNFGDIRQSVYFTYKGIKFYGLWLKGLPGLEFSLVKVKELK